MLHLLYALVLLLLLCGACAILAERFTLSPALLPLPVLSGAVVVLYLCGVAGFLRVGAVAVLLALAAVWVVGLVQYRPAGVAAAWKKAASVPGFTLFLGGAAFIWLLFCVQQPMFTQWDEFTAWGLAPKMVVERRILCGRPGQPEGVLHLPGNESDHIFVPTLRPLGRVGLSGRH